MAEKVRKFNVKVKIKSVSQKQSSTSGYNKPANKEIFNKPSNIQCFLCKGNHKVNNFLTRKRVIELTIQVLIH